MTDIDYIKRTFELALKGAASVNPNPLVGAVIVKDGQIISEGFHAKVGSDHAEASAFNNATQSVKGATLYCNLEPCCHTNKRTPPCAQRIIQEGIKKVVISNLDPNPLVAGRGISLLKDHGIEVVTGVLENEGKILNEIFFTHIQEKRAFVHLKIAQTLDGKIASTSGDSKWITGELSRNKVHQERLKFDAILIGANTARVDNPSLTVRLDKTYPKKRIILSSSGDLSSNLNLFSDEYKDLTWLILPNDCTPKINHQFINCPTLSNGNFDLNALNTILYEKLGITSIYVEGGNSIHTQYLSQSAYDRLSIFIAPKILGSGQNAIGDLGISKMSDALNLKKLQCQIIGEDIVISASKEDICSLD